MASHFAESSSSETDAAPVKRQAITIHERATKSGVPVCRTPTPKFLKVTFFADFQQHVLVAALFRELRSTRGRQPKVLISRQQSSHCASSFHYRNRQVIT